MPAQDFPAVGLCRFSFVGRGDWRAYRGNEIDPSDEEFRLNKAKELYSPERMNKRLFTLERFLLQSLDAQTDKNFIFLILTSDLMPEKYKAHLIKITKDREYAKLIFSNESTVDSAFIPELTKIRGKYGHSIPQFRVDDDDALCSTFISLLRRAAIRHQDIRNFSFGFSEGLVMTAYSGSEPCFYTYRDPFIGAGVSVVTPNLEQTIYSFCHYGVSRRFPSFTQNGVLGFLLSASDGHDSRKIPDRAPGKFTQINENNFRNKVQNNFPSLFFSDIVSLCNHEYPEIE